MTVSETTIKRSKPGKNLTKLCPGVKDNDQSIYVRPKVFFQRLIILIEQMEDMACSFKCVCVCVCVFKLFYLLVSSGCMTSVTYVRSSDQRSFVEIISRGFCQVPSSLFLNLSYFTSKDENSNWRENG